MSTELLLTAWKQAFHLFSKKEFFLFFLGWLNTFKRSATIFLKYFWWLIALGVAVRFQLLPQAMCHLLNNHPLITTALVSSITMFAIYFGLLSIRASIETKNLFYFFTQLKKIPFFALIYVLFSAVFFRRLVVLDQKFIFLLQGTVGISLWLSFFFFLDNLPLKQALKCGFKAFLMYLPSFGILYLMYLSIYFLIAANASILSAGIYYTSLNLLHFFFVCALGMLYIRIRHNFYSLLFE